MKSVTLSIFYIINNKISVSTTHSFFNKNLWRRNYKFNDFKTNVSIFSISCAFFTNVDLERVQSVIFK